MITGNVVLPFLFYEVIYLLFAFVFIVFIEVIIIRLFLAEKFSSLLEISLTANFLTTLIGYPLEGLFRFLFGMFIIPSEKIKDNPLLLSLIGKVGLYDKMYKDFNIEVITTIATSTLIAFLISVYFESKIFYNKYSTTYSKDLIKKSVVISNLISYLFLAFGIYFSYKLQMKK